MGVKKWICRSFRGLRTRTRGIQTLWADEPILKPWIAETGMVLLAGC